MGSRAIPVPGGFVNDQVHHQKTNHPDVSKPDSIAIVNPIEKRGRSQLHSTEQGRSVTVG